MGVLYPRWTDTQPTPSSTPLPGASLLLLLQPGAQERVPGRGAGLSSGAGAVGRLPAPSLVQLQPGWTSGPVPHREETRPQTALWATETRVGCAGGLCCTFRFQLVEDRYMESEGRPLNPVFGIRPCSFRWDHEETDWGLGVKGCGKEEGSSCFPHLEWLLSGVLG